MSGEMYGRDCKDASRAVCRAGEAEAGRALLRNAATMRCLAYILEGLAVRMWTRRIWTRSERMPAVVRMANAKKEKTAARLGSCRAVRRRWIFLTAEAAGSVAYGVAGLNGEIYEQLLAEMGKIILYDELAHGALAKRAIALSVD